MDFFIILMLVGAFLSLLSFGEALLEEQRRDQERRKRRKRRDENRNV